MIVRIDKAYLDLGTRISRYMRYVPYLRHLWSDFDLVWISVFVSVRQTQNILNFENRTLRQIFLWPVGLVYLKGHQMMHQDIFLVSNIFFSF